MMVANSFDLWQKDAFFPAAEEVQESADVMESAYRLWIKEKNDGSKQEDLDELSRELQIALGTTKWQLEEFQRAVALSYGHHGHDITVSRHKQFIAAVESQILGVEAALSDALGEEGKQHIQWVNLDKEECDDLAMFLSGIPQTSQLMKEDYSVLRPSMKSSVRENLQKRRDADYSTNATSSIDISDEKCFSDAITSNKSGDFILDVEENNFASITDGIICQAEKTTSTRRVGSSQNIGALRVAIADEDDPRSSLISSAEATPKGKGSKAFWRKRRCGDNQWEKGAINSFCHVFCQVGGVQRQFQAPLQEFRCSIQVTLALMLSIFLIVPFLLYLT